MNLTAQTQFPKYSIGTDLSSVLEFRQTVWLNQKYFRKNKKEDRYQSIIFDLGYITVQSENSENSLDNNKFSFKLRAGTNFYKKKKNNFFTYHGILLGMKSVHFSQVDEIKILQTETDLDSTDISNYSFGPGIILGLFLSALTPPTTTTTMLREGNMTQYSLQYTYGFEFFLSKYISIENSYHIGVKHKHYQLTRGIEEYYLGFPPSSDDFKNQSYYGIDIDIAIKLNFLLY
jgi:hypothetical protein